MKDTVRIFSLQKKYKRHAEDVKRAANACLFVLKKDEAQVEICLMGDKEMRKLNRTFRGRDKPTNVLSFKEPKNFPHPELKKGKKMSVKLGEVYLAPDYIERKKEDIEYCVIHGILHLLGYTHERLRDRMEMEKKEQSILKFFTYVQNTNLPRYRFGPNKRSSNGKRKRRSHNVRLGI